MFYTDQELVIGLKLGNVKSGIRDDWSSSDHSEMFSGDRASVYCPGSSGQTLSSVIATCHSNLGVVIIPLTMSMFLHKLGVSRSLSIVTEFWE